MNRLYRSRKNRIIGGVAGGLAEYFDVDVVLVRVLWVLAIFVGGGGLFAYLIAWIIIPEEKDDSIKRGKIKTKKASEGKIPEEKKTAGEEEEEEMVAAEGPEYSAEESGEETAVDEAARLRRRRNAGLVLIGLGILLLIRQFFGFLFQYLWPVFFIALGIYFLLRSGKEEKQR